MGQHGMTQAGILMAAAGMVTKLEEYTKNPNEQGAIVQIMINLLTWRSTAADPDGEMS